ncbi:NAD(P)-dependent oxidoreductase [Paenibacillus durus]|nr:NAD(P)-dependent oxidoreductase [Paenibacillus durus]
MAKSIVCLQPLTDKTRHLSDSSVFSAFKAGAYYINIGQ